jgi:predicted nucleic acid-binding protein
MLPQKLEESMRQAGKSFKEARGPLAIDAHIAAHAIEHGAVLATNDRDFTRFEGLRTMNPVLDTE